MFPSSIDPISKKVYDLFSKMKQKTDEIEAPAQSSEPNIAELQQEAMNSYRLHSDVIKTENGFEVANEGA